MRIALLVVMLCGLAAPAAHAAAAKAGTPALGDLSKVGSVRFPTTCDPAVQKEFERGLALRERGIYQVDAIRRDLELHRNGQVLLGGQAAHRRLDIALARRGGQVQQPHILHIRALAVCAAERVVRKDPKGLHRHEPAQVAGHAFDLVRGERQRLGTAGIARHQLEAAVVHVVGPERPQHVQAVDSEPGSGRKVSIQSRRSRRNRR